MVINSGLFVMQPKTVDDNLVIDDEVNEEVIHQMDDENMEVIIQEDGDDNIDLPQEDKNDDENYDIEYLDNEVLLNFYFVFFLNLICCFFFCRYQQLLVIKMLQKNLPNRLKLPNSKQLNQLKQNWFKLQGLRKSLRLLEQPDLHLKLYQLKLKNLKN